MKFTLFVSFFSWTIITSYAQEAPKFSFDSYTEHLNNKMVQDNFIGGLSGITFDPYKNRYLAISDNSETPKNVTGIATIYSFDIVHRDSVMAIDNIAVLPLKDVLASTNPESLRARKSDIIISTEGEDHTEVLKVSANGELLEEIYQTKEMRYNSGIEGLCLTDNEKDLFISMERPLDNHIVRGSAAEENLGVISIYRYNLENNTLNGQFLYPLHLPSEGSQLTPKETESYRKDNGVTEILAYNDSTLLFLERAFLGRGNENLHVRLYMASITNDNNLMEGNFELLKPVKVYDFYESNLPCKIDNIEGMTFSKDKKRLYLISDDNFDRYGEQKTQIIALKVHRDQ
ncbi:MAG: esterase-like activity of phytase family protein [Cyclobacteriaceae bacterium]